ncbi:DUF1835 domain-containing protein [Psychrobacillus vulpis]|uniref:DUF1835 domain-containing protein n=1 Tax=Psychrobacillus vulpis TaxID=2325572 RepID=A0A544TPS5_9BACI|nr:DUF1835 domain-containing protein [Psychrobacillus vulpis]TQR19412.1 DUF1835 domain-containing protein [Psychrobacillus vulpis]
MIHKIKKIVEQLSDQEAKSLLLQHFLRIQMLEETNYSEDKFIEGMKKEYEELLKYASESKRQPYHKVHIMFGDSPAGSLRITLPKDEKVIAFSDQFSIGPVNQLHTEKGLEQRKKWLFLHINLDEQYTHTYIEEFQQTIAEIKNISELVPIYIWTANNAHEQTAVRFVIHALKDMRNNIRIINISQNHWSTEAEEYFPLNTGEVTHENLKVVYEANKNIQPLTVQVRNKYAEEWRNLAVTKEVLRIWENDQIKSVPENYFDAYITDRARHLHNKQTNPDFMKSARLIGEVIGHLNQYIGDEFIEYRVRKLILNGVFEIEGVPKAMRFYSVKLKKRS